MVLSEICTCQPRLQTSYRPDGIFTRFALVLAGRRCLCLEWHGDLLIVHRNWQHSCLCACSRSKVPIAPMGFSHVLRFCLQGGGVYVQGGSVSFSSCTITGNTAFNYVRAHAQKFPSPRWETHIFARCLQGGGIRVDGGSVSLIYCQVHSNQASYVRGLTLKSSHRPDENIADVLAPTHACTTANTSVNYSLYVPQRTLKTSHRPDGRLTFCSLFAGRRCLCRRGRLSDL